MTTKQIISTTKSPAAIGAYSQAVKFGELVFTSGQIPLIPETMEIAEGGISEQTKQVMENLMAVLAEANADASSVIKTTCYIKNMNDFAAFNTVYSEYFPENSPARACVEVARLPKDVLVEIEAIAISKA
ncbi:endoribonuclease L-PSP [Psychromonas ingrahamii 37]|uniref:Endoribonuclease L-PSP n=1 Tax=Psychromonas ingrahamii (strain DSM 17664 / CCUG 51855 / 37) TaxID=357804 RepID=A1T063_PSYIN|nr:RidA family protein [Psychromonas ingrahamii]ABM05128.1 endoribonuclease L-PSP [Psychromonas ingrahamii 37]